MNVYTYIEAELDGERDARYQLQVRGNWAGAGGSWRPGVAGTDNATGLPDAEASTFETEEEAIAALESLHDVTAAVGGLTWALTEDVEAAAAEGEPIPAERPTFRVVVKS